mmetsp:Transcript_40443/g.86131  ORF Transcript_40443/g.86131 Transcript_40443/m.86131 type:complete len:210 (-) Transcript_40443:47-676(-)
MASIFFAILCIFTTSALDRSMKTAGGVCDPLPVLRLDEFANESAWSKASSNSSADSWNSIKSSTYSESRSSLIAFSIWNKGDDVPILPNSVRMTSPPPTASAHFSVDQFCNKSSNAGDTFFHWPLAESAVIPTAYARWGNITVAAATVAVIFGMRNNSSRRGDDRISGPSTLEGRWPVVSTIVLLASTLLILCHAVTSSFREMNKIMDT